LQTLNDRIPLALGETILIPSRLENIKIIGEPVTDILMTTCTLQP